MKYTIELTEKEHEAINGFMDLQNMVSDLFEETELEPIKTTNVEDTNEYQIGYKTGYEKGKKCLSDSELERIWKDRLDQAKQEGYNNGFEDGNKIADKDLKEIQNSTYDVAYNKALKDVNHALDVLKGMTGTECAEWFEDCVGVDEVVCGFTVQRIVEITKAYEEKKKAEGVESIKVGDEVKDLSTNNIGVVLSIGQQMIIYMTKINHIYSNTRGSLEKTGRHFVELEEILDKLKG